MQNKSSEWGTYPWHWYATSAIPRALNVSVVFACVGLGGCSHPQVRFSSKHNKQGGSWLRNLTLDCVSFDTETRLLWYYVSPAFLFMGLYSLLPHKELRFVFPALPLLNLAAAKGLSALLGSSSPSDASDSSDSASSALIVRKWLRRGAKWGARALLLAGIALYFVFLAPSTRNYPGGMALHRLLHSHMAIYKVSQQCRGITNNKECPVGRPVTVHIDADAAMTGVTRFGQLQPVNNRGFTVEYSKKRIYQKTRQPIANDWLITSSPTAKSKVTSSS